MAGLNQEGDFTIAIYFAVKTFRLGEKIYKRKVRKAFHSTTQQKCSSLQVLDRSVLFL